MNTNNIATNTTINWGNTEKNSNMAPNINNQISNHPSLDSTPLASHETLDHMYMGGMGAQLIVHGTQWKMSWGWEGDSLATTNAAKRAIMGRGELQNKYYENAIMMGELQNEDEKIKARHELQQQTASSDTETMDPRNALTINIL
jgi:hypothetical protein